MESINDNKTSLLAAARRRLAAPVQAATFTFDFSNVNGAVSGEVSGRFVLPDGNGTFAATSVTIDSYPARLGLGTTPIILSWGSENSFTVSSGVRSSADPFAHVNGARVTSIAPGSALV